MNIENQQLEEIYRSISEQFVNHPLIRIEAVKGDPPEQYEVTYKIPCAVRTPDGKIVQQSGHTIIITIPFGFPHFPPTCKPKGLIFHPDFDSAAICLGDFWQNNRDLGALIRHIGAMLSGEIYSTENAFNEEAAHWYREHSDQLPFAVTGLIQQGWSPDGDAVKKNEETLTLELDTLDEKELGAQKQHSAQIDGNQTKSARLWELSQKKHYMRLKRELDALELNESVEGQEALVQKTHAALAEARGLYHQADEEECQGALEKAAELYERVADKVADFPDIDIAIQRAKNTTSVLSDLYKPQTPPPPVLAGPGGPPDLPQVEPARSHLPATRKKDNRLVATPPKKTASFYQQKLHIGIVPLTAVACLAIFAAALGYLWLSSTAKLGMAEGLLSQCRQAMVELDFYKAENACHKAQTTAESVLFASSERRDALIQNVKNILESEEYRQGLLGNILIEGRYVAKDMAEQQKIFQDALKEATIENAAGHWPQAANAYRKALAIQEAYSGVRVDSRLAIEQQLALAETRLFLEKAHDSLNNGDKAKALEYLLAAKKSVTKVSPEAMEELSATINSLLAQRQFADLKEQADQLLAQSDWEGARALFQQAMLLGQALSASQRKDLEGIGRNVSRANLYAAIEEGNQAFANGKWNGAISRYGAAMSMAKSGSLGFNKQDVEKLDSWLQKLILQTTIIQNRQQADAALAQGNKEEAKSSLQEIINLIRVSPFSGERQFFEITGEMKDKLERINDEELIADKTKYLLSNYKTLMQRASLDVKTDNLGEPQVSFEEKRQGKYLFQVLSKQMNRRIAVKTQFLYDPEKNQWSVYFNPE